MARLRGGLGASPDQDPSQDQNQQVPQIGGAMGNLPTSPTGDPAQGNLEKPREIFGNASAAPTQGLSDPSKSTLPGGTNPNEHSNDAPGRPQSPTPIASQPPQPFTPLPSQDTSSMIAPVGSKDPAAFTSPVFGGTSSLRQPGLLSGGSGGQLRGGLGAPADGDQAVDPLSQLLRMLGNKGGQGQY